MLYLKAALALVLVPLSIPFFIMACLCLLLKMIFNHLGLTFGTVANEMIEFISPEDLPR